MKNLKQKCGITLIALIITIIVLLILSGVTISMLTGDKGILKNAQLAAEKTKVAKLEEKVNLWLTEIYMAETTGGIAKNINEVLNELLQEGLLTEEDVNKIKANENNEIVIGDKVISFKTDYYVSTADGSWDNEKKVNTPKLKNTGLIPIYFDSTNNAIELTSKSTEMEWDKWYDYEDNKWANAITKDNTGNITGYFVWIPRYAYKIKSNLGTGTTGEIEIKFLQGNTNQDENGNIISKEYPSVENNTMLEYVIHPSFTDGTLNKWQNGEWDEEIEGFWIAKYEAGFQANTTDVSGKIINGTDTVVYSKYKYSAVYNDATNALSQSITKTNYTNEYLSYPVFKPLTYSYNLISSGDSYTISRQIQDATNFYGLKNVDSHMMKNSEWGAMVYLTHSKYGRNGTSVKENSKNLNNLNSKNIYSVTGYAEDRPLGVDASSTGNITGIFDISGCAGEIMAAYITSGNSGLETFAKSFAYLIAEENPQTRSTKYATAYPYHINNTSEENYNFLKSNFVGKKFGDAILETSYNSSTDEENLGFGWGPDMSIYPGSHWPVFFRGGHILDTNNFTEKMGIFNFCRMNAPTSYSFRAIIVPN